MVVATHPVLFRFFLSRLVFVSLLHVTFFFVLMLPIMPHLCLPCSTCFFCCTLVLPSFRLCTCRFLVPSCFLFILFVGPPWPLFPSVFSCSCDSCCVSYVFSPCSMFTLVMFPSLFFSLIFSSHLQVFLYFISVLFGCISKESEENIFFFSPQRTGK